MTQIYSVPLIQSQIFHYHLIGKYKKNAHNFTDFNFIPPIRRYCPFLIWQQSINLGAHLFRQHYLTDSTLIFDNNMNMLTTPTEHHRRILDAVTELKKVKTTENLATSGRSHHDIASEFLLLAAQSNMEQPRMPLLRPVGDGGENST